MTISRMLLTLGAAFFGWITVMALVMRFSDAAPAAVAFFPQKGFVGNLPENAAVIATGRLSFTVSGNVTDMGAALYKAGAWLILPAGLTGCLPLPKTAGAER